ncbi:MAG: N-acetylglucosamine-6-phosphate deacetylase [Akkermansiaceae bacterium]|nr:N-acetylglucosamine-6-phosphate deacetylase [Armatimonadota bacterium]
MIVQNAHVVSEQGVTDRNIGIENGKFNRNAGTPSSSPGSQVLDATGFTLLPGFIDIHIHGGGGSDTMDATPDALRTICRTHARNGTTGLLLTTMTQSREKITNALAAARNAYESGADFCPDGAQVLGIHLEGPYISAKRPGAQPKEFVRPYDAAEFAEWLDVAGAALKLITLAPEEPGADDLIRICQERGIVVSFGHTDASAEQTRAALDISGYAHATHLFNAMPALHHRNPGVLGVALTDDRMRCEIISDGHHVAPEIARLALEAKKDRNVILITDAMAGAGAPDGAYDLGGHVVAVANGKALLSDGTLAGSVLTMAQAVRNMREWTNAGWDTLRLISSTNAANALGIINKGRIATDADADFVLVDDSLTVRGTYIGGRCVFKQ